MAFEKGKSGNPNGRKQGSQNKATAAVKERIEAVLTELDSTILTDVGWLNSTERVALWLKLQEYVRPKLQRVTLTPESETARPAQLTVRVVNGYYGKDGNFIECPPLRASEKEVEAEIEKEERLLARVNP
jgi:hypothetical protein